MTKPKGLNPAVGKDMVHWCSVLFLVVPRPILEETTGKTT